MIIVQLQFQGVKMINKLGLILLFVFTFVSASNQYSQSILTKKIYPMGKKIFLSKCSKNIELSKYTNINELQDSIVNDKLCKKIKGNFNFKSFTIGFYR